MKAPDVAFVQIRDEGLDGPVSQQRVLVQVEIRQAWDLYGDLFHEGPDTIRRDQVAAQIELCESFCELHLM
eukprot:CAMPEP_0205928910 /NCGR_PEP_ID=MMETSP1325-20131115/25007_1 /ASSEMBLY_ACC=CAM_ASM_000708 /TAXON_ID=236786 /ORGANISM="Florenciella sp., Strain RCC1007" /LENGTH=70 /DNA_ID=CAMNT_0053298047 /DNA_START=185 /DNA_END=397 /DNA_ORIENTATION=+